MDTILGMDRSADDAAGRKRAGFGPGGGLAAGLLDWIMVRVARSRERRALLGLDDWILKDIGLTRADVMSESDKPFWQQ